MTTDRSYIICTSPRSGSTLLCKLLKATGIAGDPDSYFHEPSIARWQAYLGMTPDPVASERKVLAAVFQAAVERGRGDSGVFGLRLQRHSFKFFVEKLAVLHPRPRGDLERLQAAFGRILFIHLTRTDKVQQAVSYVKAKQTGLWHKAPDGTELERLSPPRGPVYDAEHLRSCYDRFVADDVGWNAWFDALGVTPLRLTYEQVSGNPRAALEDVLDGLGLDRAAAEGIVPGVAKLADATNREWETRFRQDLGLS
ncbi:MAG: sulfotransferase [Roseibium sp.]|nr:sulfotransferase [Roseibium sp.]